MTARPHIYGLVPGDLARLLTDQGIGHDLGDVRRLLAQRINRRAGDPRTPSPVARRTRDAVEALTEDRPLCVLERATDPADGFVKYLFESHDGATFEAVRIPLHKPGRFSVCLSSQVGCAMQCAFCATGRLGLTRNLAAWEMVAQWLAIRDEAPGRVTGAVFMGQGEPLQNYAEVVQAARVLSEPCGGSIAARAISISTVGFPDVIRRYTREGHAFRLIVSLNSALPARRRELMPVAARVDLEELADALRAHDAATPGRQTVAYVLLAGVNTGSDEVAALRRLLDGVRLRINLLDYNEFAGGRYRRAARAELDAFVDALQVLEVPVVRRYSGGASCHAACGMLQGKRAGSLAT